MKGRTSRDRGDTRALFRAFCLVLAIIATWVFRKTQPQLVLSAKTLLPFWSTGSESAPQVGANLVSAEGVANAAPGQKITYTGKDIVLVVGSDGGHPLDVHHAAEIKENRADFAAFHGYDLMWANLSDYRKNDEHAVWAKVMALIDCFNRFPDAKWIWWLDLDALIMTPSLDLGQYLLNPDAMYEKLMKDRKFPISHLGQSIDQNWELSADPDPNEINLLISHDQNGINAGSIFLRRNQWTELFLELWNDPILRLEKKWWAFEQDALVHLILHHNHFLKGHIGFVPQRVFNAYVPDDINRAVLSEEKVDIRAEFWEPSLLVIHFAGCWAHSNCEEWWNKYWPLRERVASREDRAWALMFD